VKKLRALVLVHSTLVPPESLAGATEKEIDEWRTEYDVITHLKAAGHEVLPLGLSDSLSELRRAIIDWKPDIVFNLLEEFDGIVTYDQHVVAFLELMHQPYTGCNPRGMLLSRDKVLSKQLLSYHRIPTPQFMVFARGKKPRIPKKLHFPMFVKSSTEDASLGIAHASVVADAKQLVERIAFIHEQTHSDALVEEYIEGRELYVGVIGNDRLKVLPVWEMTFGSLPENLPAIATRKVKWDRRYQEKYGITTAAAANLPDGTVGRLEQLSKRIFRALHLTGYARMDFRLRADGALYVLEANANPNISMAEDFAQSALTAGMRYRDVLNRILQLGANYPAAWRGIDSAR
jgi:D-alanine-D-alanine ligase